MGLTDTQPITTIINTNNHNIYLVVPYTKCLSESFKKVCNKVGVWFHFKGNNTINNLLVAPKDKDTITQKSGIIYRFKCTQAGCEEEYIRESERTFWDRLKKHFRAPTTIYQHSHSSGHCIKVHSITRTIKEAMFIRVNDPSLNGNLGKFQIAPHLGMRSCRTPQPSI